MSSIGGGHTWILYAGGTGGHYRRHCAVKRPEKNDFNELAVAGIREGGKIFPSIPTGLNGWLLSNDIQPGSDVQDETVASASEFIEKNLRTEFIQGAPSGSREG